MNIRKFAIGDLHHNHDSLAQHRGFRSSREHDALLKKNWNKVVSPTDTVFILGDVTMERANYEFLDELHGRKHVVMGNHDYPHHVRELLKHVQTVCGSYDITIGKEHNCLLTHIPIHPTMLFNYTANIHGHIHESNLGENRYINLSADAVNYTPVELTFEESDVEGYLTLGNICNTDTFASNKYIWQLIADGKAVDTWAERPCMQELYLHIASDTDMHEQIVTKYNCLLINGHCLKATELPNSKTLGATLLELKRFKITQ